MTDLINSRLSNLSLNASTHLNTILNECFNHTSSNTAIVVFDVNSELSVVLTDAYRHCLPEAQFIDFNESTPEFILERFSQLNPFDLVILIQSTSFRLEAFRIRVELFKRQLKVIEHPHLSRMPNEQVAYYIDSLAYDQKYYRGVGAALKAKIDVAPMCIVDSGGEFLTYNSPFEAAKLNVGDYSKMTNIGGQFPIGEVFTEATDLTAVNGRVRIFVFGDTSFSVNKPDHPITLIIEKGQVVNTENSTPEFDTVLSNIRQDENGVVWIRELGFGMNRAFSKTRTVSDIGTYERMCGIHLSLGAKHGSYSKPGFKRGDGRHHVDVFVDTHCVTLGSEVIYQDNMWVV